MKPLLLIIGLGNPGAQYEQTRHNMGFQACDILAKEFGTGDWQDKQKFKSLIMEGRIVTAPILLVKPQTYMNLSGEAVQKLVDFYKLDPASQILVLCDDIDLDVGVLRLRKSGGPGTHNGLKSLVDIFGEDFARLRIGVGAQRAGEDLSAYVLSKPTSEETDAFGKSFQQLSSLVQDFAVEGQVSA